MKGKNKANKVTVTHKAPGKKGKLETRYFATQAEAEEYVKRNLMPREHGKPGRILQ